MFVRLYTETKAKTRPPAIENALAKRKLITEAPSLSLVRADTFLYYGYEHRSTKHGGYLLMGRWVRDHMHGKAFIVTPFGGRLYATMEEGKVSGWCITVYKHTITCAKYFQNHLTSPVLVFQGSEELWVSAKYDEQHRLSLLTHVEAGAVTRLPSFATDPILEQMYAQVVITKHNYFPKASLICEKHISERTKYVGMVDPECNPCGLGIMYSQDQSFYGYFQGGILQDYGRMIFSNGEIYHGRVARGVFESEGFYYRPSTNSSTVVYTSDGITQPKAVMKGYNLTDCSPRVGRTTTNALTGLNNHIIKKIAEGIEQYYLKEYLNRPVDRDVSGISEEYMSMEKEHSPAKNTKSVRSKESPVVRERWLDFKDNYHTTIIQENTVPQEKESFKKESPQHTALLNKGKNEFLKMKEEGSFKLEAIKEDDPSKENAISKEISKEEKIDNLLKKVSRGSRSKSPFAEKSSRRTLFK